MNNPVAFIPARGGSKSIPRKNIKMLGGKPLIAWSIETALAVGLRTIVNTDDPEIARIAREYGAEVMEMTPEDARERGIHQDDSSMFDVLKSEIPRIESVPDIVLLLQPTAPFRTVEDVKEAIRMFNKDTFDSLVSVESVPEKFNPDQVLVNGKMADGRPISQRKTRRQDFVQAYIPTGQLYLFKTSNLERGSFYGERVQMFPCFPTININDVADWEAAELWLQKSSAK